MRVGRHTIESLGGIQSYQSLGGLQYEFSRCIIESLVVCQSFGKL